MYIKIFILHIFYIFYTLFISQKPIDTFLFFPPFICFCFFIIHLQFVYFFIFAFVFLSIFHIHKRRSSSFIHSFICALFSLFILFFSFLSSFLIHKLSHFSFIHLRIFFSSYVSSFIYFSFTFLSFHSLSYSFLIPSIFILFISFLSSFISHSQTFTLLTHSLLFSVCIVFYLFFYHFPLFSLHSLFISHSKNATRSFTVPSSSPRPGDPIEPTT